MSYSESVSNGARNGARLDDVTFEGLEHLQDQPYVYNGRELRPATDEVLAEVAHEAMLLSQGADRAAEMMSEAAALQRS